MGRGHRLDANTFAMLRMDEAAAGAYSVSDTVGGITFSEVTNDDAPYITNGPNNLRYARRACLSTFLRGPTVTAGDLTFWQGQWTFEAFIHPLKNVNGYIFSVAGAAGGSGVGNSQFSLQRLSTGHIVVTWQNGTGSTTITFTTTGTAPFPLGAWKHIAIVKTATSLLVYAGGVLHQTFAWSTNASVGTSARWYFNTLNAGTLDGYDGLIKDMRVSSVARSAGVISTDAALVSTTCQHPNDSDTRNLWRLNEVPDMIDSANSGIHLRADSLATTVTAHEPFIRDGGFAKGFTGTTAEFYHANVRNGDPQDPYEVALRTVFLGDFTVELWVRLFELNWATKRNVFVFQGFGGASTTNGIWLSINANRTIQFGWHTGTVVLNTVDSTFVIPTTQLGNWHHLGVRKAGAGATFDLDLTWDGVVVHSATGLTQPTIGTQAHFGVGGADLGPVDLGVTWQGLLDDMRISNIARTDREILDSYNRGMGADDYWMRARDSGLGDYVQWGPTTDPSTWLTPLAAETTPNFTGSLSNPHSWLRTSEP